MNKLIRDKGFVEDDWRREILDWDVLQQSGFSPEAGFGMDVPNTVSADDLINYLSIAGMIVIAFPHAHDGRGFTLARNLRRLGFEGRLRARGHIIADQYTMARRVGFDEIEISDDLAARQSEEQWIFRANWREHDYQARLRR